MSMRIPEMLIVSLSFRMSETVRDSLSLIDSEKLKGPLLVLCLWELFGGPGAEPPGKFGDFIPEKPDFGGLKNRTSQLSTFPPLFFIFRISADRKINLERPIVFYVLLIAVRTTVTPQGRTVP